MVSGPGSPETIQDLLSCGYGLVQVSVGFEDVPFAVKPNVVVPLAGRLPL